MKLSFKAMLAFLLWTLPTLLIGWGCQKPPATTTARDVGKESQQKSKTDGVIGKVEIHCPPRNSGFFWSACEKTRQNADQGDVIALNDGDPHPQRPTVTYLYKGEKEIVWDAKEGAIVVNREVVGVVLSELAEEQAVTLVRKHCNKIQTVVWKGGNTLSRGVLEEIGRCSQNVEGLSLNLEGFNGEEKKLAELERLAPKLIHLSLKNADVGDDSIKHLSGLANLRALSLMETAVGDDGLKHLSGFANLRVLVLPSTVTNEGIKHLSKNANLKKLDLGSTEVGDDGLKHISGFANLRVLVLPPRVGDVGMKHLFRLANLRELDLGQTQVGDEGLKSLSGLAKLAVLNLMETKVGNEGLKHLSGLANLRALNLPTKVGDEGLKHLSGLANLRALNLRGAQVGSDGLKHLSRLGNLRKLILSSTKVGDSGLKHLFELKNLRILEAVATEITEQGAGTLKSKLSVRVVLYECHDEEQ